MDMCFTAVAAADAFEFTTHTLFIWLQDSRGKAFSDSKFDYVVIATPLENSSLALNQLRDLKLPPKRPYQLVHVTLVRGRLNPQRFGLTGESEIPSQIIIAKSSTKPFFKSISPLPPMTLAMPEERTFLCAVIPSCAPSLACVRSCWQETFQRMPEN